MLSLIASSLAAVAVAGIGIKWYLERYHPDSPYRITRLEFIIEMVLIALVIAPVVSYSGMKAARSNQLTFNEFINGWERAAIRHDVRCTKNGPCVHEYDCDPYLVLVTYMCGDKNDQVCTRMETRYESCPYVTVESSFSVATSIGTFSIASSRFPENPNQHRWRASKHVPDHIINRAGTGIPRFWLAAKERLDAGRPGPASKRASYANYIYASEYTNLKQYSADVQQYLEMKLLPAPAKDVRDFYLADKVHFVGYVPEDAQRWQELHSYAASALGTELQGDLQLVITQDVRINSNPDLYAIVLKTYWQNTEAFGRDAFSKNGIGVIVGTVDGKTVSWARAFTGMPLGNEHMQVAIQSNLKGVALTPQSLFGDVSMALKADATSQAIVSNRTGGALTPVLWGQMDPATKFARVSMTANDATDHGSGFLYLYSEIRPTTGQSITIVLVVLIFGMIFWTVCARIDADALLRQLVSPRTAKPNAKGLES